MALSAVPACPAFKRSENVAIAFDLIMNKGEGIEKRAVVIGSCGVGIDVGLCLMETEGREVTVVQIEDEIGGDADEFLKRHRPGMRSRRESSSLRIGE